MATKKKAAKKAAPRKKRPRNPLRRDSSFTQETTTTTFKWRTSSEALKALSKGTANAFKRAVPIIFVSSARQFRVAAPAILNLFSLTDR